MSRAAEALIEVNGSVASISEQFLILVVKRSDTGLQSAWKTLVMSGQGTMPRTVDSEAAMVDYVSRTPGAIGYVMKSTSHEGVKTLNVQ